jgi:hypothetical protein
VAPTPVGSCVGKVLGQSSPSGCRTVPTSGEVEKHMDTSTTTPSLTRRPPRTPGSPAQESPHATQLGRGLAAIRLLHGSSRAWGRDGPGKTGALREKIRERLQAGALPLTKPARTWGGRGLDRTCGACELPITREQMEYEVEFEAPAHAALKVQHMHLTCFAAWELERELIIRASHRVP